MTKASPIEDVRGWARRQAAQYRDGEDRPLGGYLAVMGIYSTGVGAVALAGRLLGRRVPVEVSPWDLAQITVATHRIARTISKDPVTSPIRAPFTRYQGVSAAAELKEDVRSHSTLQHSIGELLSCPMCLAQWVATALTAGLVLSPRATRLVAATFTAVAGADFLQYLYAYLQKAAE
jgi:hypothetical protein